MNKLMMLENKLKNSKTKFTKNFLYYIIAPVILLILGIVFVCTMGFNGGVELNGGSSFIIYVNNGQEYSAPAVSYDIDQDFDSICAKIEEVLADGNLKAESFQKTTISIEEKQVINGDAIKVTFLNTSKDLDIINQENNSIRTRLINSFAYDEYAITDIDYQEATFSITDLLISLGTIILAISLASIYMAFRNKNASFLLGILQGTFDVLLTLAIVLALRIPVDSNISAIVIIGGVLSFANFFVFYGHTKNNIKDGVYADSKNAETADRATKALLIRKTILYIALTLASLICICLPSVGIMRVGLGILMALIASFYSSTFIMPSMWALTYKNRKQTQNN